MNTNEVDRSRKKDDNIHAILAAATKAINRGVEKHPGNSRLLLHLKRNTSAILQFEIQSPNEYREIFAALYIHNNSIFQTELAKRHFHFQQSSDQPATYMVYSYQSTAKKYEGFGLGTGLIGASDQAITRVLELYSEFFTGLPVIGYLIDNAYGQARDITRDGWTSYYAEMLGYTPSGDGSTFYKKFQ